MVKHIILWKLHDTISAAEKPAIRANAKAALEGPALGVAILAGVGTGVYPSVESACDAIVKPDTVLYPDAECGRAYEPYYQLYLRQYPALRETFHALAAMRSRA